MLCCAQSRPRSRTPRCLPKCCRYRTMDAIRTLELAPQHEGRKPGSADCAAGGLSSANPVLMIYEDVHWIDPNNA